MVPTVLHDLCTKHATKAYPSVHLFVSFRLKGTNMMTHSYGAGKTHKKLVGKMRIQSHLYLRQFVFIKGHMHKKHINQF